MNKFGWLLGALTCLVATSNLFGATNELSGALQRGLFEEEANHNFQAALQSYQAAMESYDQSRKLAATALFRMGEVYRKLGKTNDAEAQYQRLLRDFSDQPDLLTAAQKFVGSAESTTTNAAAPEKRDYEAEEISRLQKLIDEKPDLVNAGSSGNGMTPLHNAVRAGRLAVVQFLLTKNANPNVQDSDGRTPLAWAVGAVDYARFNPNIVETLLRFHADADLSDKWGQTPLHIAAYVSSKPALDMLLASGANANRQAINAGTPLHYAVARGFKSGIEALLKKGANPNLNAYNNRTVDILGRSEMVIKAEGTPLHLATSLGYSATAEALIVGGANVNAVTPNRATPLHFAVSYRQPAMVKLLLESKANVNAQTDDGTTPLSQGAAKADLELVKILLNNHADPNIANNSQVTPLHRTFESSQSAESTNIIGFLLDAGADPNAADSIGRTPLLSVNYEVTSPPETLAAMNLLLDRGATVDASDLRERKTALMAAARFANLPMVTLLLAHHANPNLKDANGITALHFLCLERARYPAAPEIARALIAAGADVNAITDSGKTPLLILSSGIYPQNSTPGFPTPVTGLPNRIVRTIPSVGMDTNEPQPPSDVKALWDVLVKQGAVRQMPDFTKVETWRGSKPGSWDLYKDEKGFNHFTLFELIAQHYFNLSTANGAIIVSRPDTDRLMFPDFTGVRIIRPSKSDPKNAEEFPLSIVTAEGAFDCSRDQQLEFGDRVDIPEKSHALSTTYNGLTATQTKSLKDCLQRTITILVSDQPHEIKLSGTMTDTYLSAALRLPEVQTLLQNTSDLSAIKVTRVDSKTDKPLTVTENVLPFWNQQKRIDDDLWLRAGDKIEVSEKR